MVFVLVSGTFEVMDTPHKGEAFGQRLDMPEHLVASAVLAGASLLPEDEFKELGFTPEELSQYPNAFAQAGAPAEFRAKHAAAIQAVREYRATLGKEK